MVVVVRGCTRRRGTKTCFFSVTVGIVTLPFVLLLLQNLLSFINTTPSEATTTTTTTGDNHSTSPSGGKWYPGKLLKQQVGKALHKSVQPDKLEEVQVRRRRT